ncbi:MAG: PQQ-binding-like beta-propeller repeat protein [Bacteroidetes bacterium]|nr:PQQ-binding-like beta-propeller repeat protein [Bacteroidota bacterium]
MRTHITILPVLALLLVACSTSYELERPLTPQPGDWLQLGGDARRSNIAGNPGEGNATSESSRQEGSDAYGDGEARADADEARADADEARADADEARADADEARADADEAHADVDEGIVWKFELDGPAAKAAPLLVDGAVLFFSTTGVGEAVELSSGERIGVFPCKWFIHATPAITDGCLFVATNGIEPLLLCFDLKERVIRYETLIPSVHASLCAVGKRVIMAARNGVVAAFAAADTVPLWRTALEDVIIAAPAASDSVVVVAGQNGDLTALAVTDGRRLWRVSTGDAFLAGATIFGTSVVSVNSAGVVRLVDVVTGELRWTHDLGQPVYQGLAVRGDTIAVALSGGDLVLLDAADGSENVRIATDELPGAAPLFHERGILLLQRRGVLMDIDPRTGGITEIARLRTRSETPPLLAPHGIVLVDEQGEAVCVDIIKGRNLK